MKYVIYFHKSQLSHRQLCFLLKYNPSINTGRLKIIVSDGLLLTNIILIQENGRIIRETLLTKPQLGIEIGYFNRKK